MSGRKDIIYFLGIGGIGMSALARYFQTKGKKIHGYDLTPTPLTRQLKKEGMHIHYEENTKHIPTGIELVVYTPAVPKTHKEYIYFTEKGIPVKKRAEVLGDISRQHFTIAIAGTHGKTSISMLTAHLLKNSGMNVTALVGGISKDYGSNFITTGKTDILVLEADEFDRSFLQLSPDISVISSVDADHLDIYHDAHDLSETFVKFAEKTKTGGVLIHHEKLTPLLSPVERKKINYSAQGQALCWAENIRIESGKFIFDFHYQDITINNIALQVPGVHSIENALAASLAAMEAGMEPSLLKKGLESFQGVERRFDYRINTEELVFIDDYAHHPNEINVTTDAVKKLYPEKKITGIFQPHLYSRTRDFYREFAQALEALDEIILLDIYPAREEPIAGVTSKMILNEIKHPNKKLLSKKELLDYLKQNKPEVLLTLGAGDIGLMLNDIEKTLKS